MSVHPIPDGVQAVVPYIVCDDVEALIAFLVAAFEAAVKERVPGAGGRTSHAELLVGGCTIMMGEHPDPSRRTRSCTYVYVPDCDAAYERALAAGGETEREPADQFYGDRSAGVRDRFGNAWWMATHVEDVAPDELARRAAEAHGGG